MSKKSKQKQRMRTVQGSMAEPSAAAVVAEQHSTLPRVGVNVGHSSVVKMASRAVDGVEQALTPSTDRLPGDVARRIIESADSLNIDPARVPDISDAEVNRLITENPETALEGLTRLGRVMVMPSATPAESTNFDPLEVKARVLGDIRKGHIDAAEEQRVLPLRENMPGFSRVEELTLAEAVQIDAQAVYNRWMAAGKGNDLYELRMAPPWVNAIIMYNSPVGNVWALHMVASDLTGPEWTDEYLEQIRWETQPPATHEIEWERVRWVYSVQAYVGGYGQHEDENGLTSPQWVPTTGPLMIWRFAIYDDGEPADIHWTHVIPAVPIHKFNNALGVFTEVLNMLNCTNVTVAYPTRSMPRAQRRRFERMGVRFSEIHVKPASKSYKGNGEALADMEMPIHGVRGHYATYGKDGRGLLFGKLAGRFWIPPHMRGSAEHGEVAQTYVTE